MLPRAVRSDVPTLRTFLAVDDGSDADLAGLDADDYERALADRERVQGRRICHVRRWLRRRRSRRHSHRVSLRLQIHQRSPRRHKLPLRSRTNGE